ncbi:hypothetical protein ACETK8_19350 [Brevundimonas staleyi]|uniref:General secretion pathway protein GspM n=1 Tax=Brevundimonas staleyi TaxID=74326 RepID=A0ABW0FQJ4_9CAUL
MPADIAAWVRVRSALLTERLARTTVRERVLLGGLVLGALAYAPIAALDWRTAQEEAYVDALTERSAARLERAAARRVSAAAADVTAVEDMKDWGFDATNPAVAGVLIERRIKQAADTAELTRLKITVDSGIEDEGSTTWLGAEVEADLVWRGVFRFLDILSSWPEGFRVTRFNYEVRPVPPGMEGIAGQLSPGTVRIGLAFPVTVETRDEEAPAVSAAQSQPARAAATNGMFDTGPQR